MTKPVTEPTPALEASNYGYRIRQLERRPAPVSEAGALPYAWLRWSYVGNGFTPFPAADSTVYSFYDLNIFGSGGMSWYTSDITIFSPDEVNGFINTDPAVIGVLHSRVYAEFDSVDYDFVQSRQTWLSTEDISGGPSADFVTGWANPGNFLLGIPTGESAPSLQAEFQQTSGVTEDLLGLSLLIVRDAVYPAAGGVAYP